MERINVGSHEGSFWRAGIFFWGTTGQAGKKTATLISEFE
jgi:hypothetical protein